MKIVYIARDVGLNVNGAGQVMHRNKVALQRILGKDNVIEYILPKSNLKSVLTSIIQAGSYGITKKEEQCIIEKIKQVKPDFVFIESSSYGSLYKKLDELNIKTICFAHNLDTLLSKQEITSRSPLISIPKYLLTRYNEKKTSRYCNVLICLSKRDSEGFKKQFGRSADMVVPITFPKRTIYVESINADRKPYLLFVGSDFFPNVEGIKWFIDNVAPYINIDVHIVGGCCNNPLLKKISIPKNVKILGYVDNLEYEYLEAVGVIAPIFKGSGMKTKTIEAMSYYKSIYGTDEAFAGIECDYSKIGGLCNNAEEFIKVLNGVNNKLNNVYTEDLFNRKYSDEQFEDNLRCLFKELFGYTVSNLSE